MLTSQDSPLSLKERVEILKKERNAIILAHYYQRREVQEVADYIGDSFGLAQQAAKTNADVILFAGVHFMAESAKILNPEKIVLIPDDRAGCPMADMVNIEGLRRFKKEHPNATVVAYINTSAEVKAETDICCTSSNAIKVVNSVPTDEVIWIPDKNLGAYVQQFTKKKLLIWEGYCNTHDQLTVEDVFNLKEKYPNALFAVHPEAKPEVVALGDFVGSTTQIIEFAKKSTATEFIIGTEEGVGYTLEKENPEKKFYFASKYLVCPNMKVNTLKKVVKALENLQPQIYVPNEIREKAKLSLERMLQVK